MLQGREGDSMNVTIPKSLEALILQKVEDGYYSTEQRQFEAPLQPQSSRVLAPLNCLDH
jgi:hypothetical protein